MSVDLQAVLANVAMGGSSGAIGNDAVEALQKALTAGYGTDVSTLQGGGALRIQSLDKTMQAVIQDNAQFQLFNRLAKPKAGGTVDEWTEQNSIGGFLGGSTNTETGVINQATGGYARRVGQVKYLMTQRQVSLVLTLQNAIEDAEAVERANGALQLLTDAEYLCFEGNSSVVPTEFDGIEYQMTSGVAQGVVPSGNVIDLRAQPLNSIDYINQAARVVRGYGSWGMLSDIFWSPSVQADMDNNLQPAFRIALPDNPRGLELGTSVVGIRTAGATIKSNEDTFIREQDLKTPFDVQQAAVAAAQVGIKPAAVAGAVAGNASSLFTAAQAGNYYYAVAGQNLNGQSGALVSAQIAVAAGQGVTLTITASASGLETGYVIYRGRQNGTNALSDLREVCRIPYAGPTTTWVDTNALVPGTTKAYALDMRPSQTAILWRQLLPMMKFNLFPTNAAIIPWAQLLMGYLRVSKRKHCVVFQNILPTGSAWQPFT